MKIGKKIVPHKEGLSSFQRFIIGRFNPAPLNTRIKIQLRNELRDLKRKERKVNEDCTQ